MPRGESRTGGPEVEEETVTDRYRQFRLQEDGGSAEVTCWLLDEPRLSHGSILTLRETGDRVWRVLNAYSETIDRASLHRPWRVGGLEGGQR